MFRKTSYLTILLILSFGVALISSQRAEAASSTKVCQARVVIFEDVAEQLRTKYTEVMRAGKNTSRASRKLNQIQRKYDRLAKKMKAKKLKKRRVPRSMKKKLRVFRKKISKEMVEITPFRAIQDEKNAEYSDLINEYTRAESAVHACYPNYKPA